MEGYSAGICRVDNPRIDAQRPNPVKGCSKPVQLQGGKNLVRFRRRIRYGKMGSGPRKKKALVRDKGGKLSCLFGPAADTPHAGIDFKVNRGAAARAAGRFRQGVYIFGVSGKHLKGGIDDSWNFFGHRDGKQQYRGGNSPFPQLFAFRDGSYGKVSRPRGQGRPGYAQGAVAVGVSLDRYTDRNAGFFPNQSNVIPQIIQMYNGPRRPHIVLYRTSLA
jgi:hypothetical protein